MDMNPERKIVAAVFKNEARAAKALERLMAAKFDLEADVGVAVSNGQDRQAIPIWSDVPVGRTAAIGAAMGAVLAAIGVLVAGIDFGPFSLVEWGPAFAAFEAAYAGGGVGMAMGAMMSFEFAEPRAAFHLARIHDGAVWVGVRAAGARAEQAHWIMVEAGGRHVPDDHPTAVAA
jgi:hypothetical protein